MATTTLHSIQESAVLYSDKQFLRHGDPETPRFLPKAPGAFSKNIQTRAQKRQRLDTVDIHSPIRSPASTYHDIVPQNVNESDEVYSHIHAMGYQSIDPNHPPHHAADMAFVDDLTKRLHKLQTSLETNGWSWNRKVFSHSPGVRSRHHKDNSNAVCRWLTEGSDAESDDEASSPSSDVCVELTSGSSMGTSSPSPNSDVSTGGCPMPNRASDLTGQKPSLEAGWLKSAQI